MTGVFTTFVPFTAFRPFESHTKTLVLYLWFLLTKHSPLPDTVVVFSRFLHHIKTCRLTYLLTRTTQSRLLPVEMVDVVIAGTDGLLRVIVANIHSRHLTESSFVKVCFVLDAFSLLLGHSTKLDGYKQRFSTVTL